ncbi:MAG: restriction endonuclease subunit S, partial [Cyanobacteria bacterium J06635_1]
NPDVEPAEKLLERIRVERRANWEATELEKMKAKGKVLKNDKWKERYKAPLDFDAPDLPKLHSNWTWMSADECTSLITDGEHATPKRTKEGVYLLSARNVLNGEISLEKVDYISEELHQKLNQRLQLQFGDVLLSCSGTVGRSCTVPEGLECSFVRSVAILKPLLNMGEYLSLSIRSPVVQNQIERKKTQTAQSNLFQGRIKVLAFPLAPIGEQTEILRRINDLMVIADAIKKKYSEIVVEQTQLDQSILAKAFRGELVSQDPNDEPASVLLERIRAEREKTLKKGEGERLKGKGKQQVQISLPLDKVES